MPNFILKQTCGGCPESYNVYHNDEYVGHLRLRNGIFTAYFQDRATYQVTTIGDGIFESEEREYHLQLACETIWAEMVRNKNQVTFEVQYE